MKAPTGRSGRSFVSPTSTGPLQPPTHTVQFYPILDHVETVPLRLFAAERITIRLVVVIANECQVVLQVGQGRWVTAFACFRLYAESWRFVALCLMPPITRPAFPFRICRSFAVTNCSTSMLPSGWKQMGSNLQMFPDVEQIQDGNRFRDLGFHLLPQVPRSPSITQTTRH